MKLKYKILWIEDEFDSIERPKRQIQKYLEDDYGFECKEEDIVIKDYDEFEEEFIYEENSQKRVNDSIKEFDLLLVDFNLGEEEQTGDKLIEVIRAGIYSEILFYSSELESVTKKLNNHFIDGVFTSDREHLEEKIKKLITVTIKKVQDVNNLRGLIMAEVAELDVLKEEIINLAAQKVPNKELEKYTLTKIQSSGESNSKMVKKHLEEIDNITFALLFENIGFVDSNKKAMTIGEALKKLNITEPVTKKTFTDPYIENILKKRNKFAHIKECERDDGTGKQCKFIGDIPFTAEKCIEIRKEIRDYKKILEDIKNAII